MDLAAEERFMASSFAAIAAREVAPLYAANFGVSNRALPSALKDVPLHIAPKRNCGLDMSPGINVPIYYLSGTLSFSEIHAEDGSPTRATLLTGVSLAPKSFGFLFTQTLYHLSTSLYSRKWARGCVRLAMTFSRR